MARKIDFGLQGKERGSSPFSFLAPSALGKTPLTATLEMMKW
jgi:hypothetical protein